MLDLPIHLKCLLKRLRKAPVVPNLAPPIQIPATQLDPIAFNWLPVNIMFCNVIKKLYRY